MPDLGDILVPAAEMTIRLLVGAGVVSVPGMIVAVVLVVCALVALSVLVPKAAAELARLLRLVKVEPAPAPVSDGGAAADRELPPALEGGGPAGGGPTGGEG